MVSEFYPTNVIYPDTAIVMANGFAGSVTGNFGQAAETIAELTGAAVFAYDRAGTGNRTVISLALRHQLTPSRVVQRVSQIGQVINARLDSLHKNVVAFGQSGGAPEATALTLTDTLHVIGLGMSEPVAIRTMSTLRGIGIEALYDFRHERPARHMTPKAEGTISQEPSKYIEPTRSQKIGKTLLEVFYYSALWPTTFTLDKLHDIGLNRPDIAVYIALAAKSLNGNETRISDVAESMSRYRHLTLNKPFRAEVWPDTLHSAFDKPEIASKVIQRTVDLAGISPS